MTLEIYAVFDTNDCPKRLKSSGIDEFYYYFPPPLPPLIVLFMITKDDADVNYLFKISVCIDNELEDKYIGEMGVDKLSICWNGDWTMEEITHAKTVTKLGRVLKLAVFKEELPPPEEDEEEEEEEEDEEEEEEFTEEEFTEEEKSLNEDELLKSSIAMLEDELDENDIAVQKLNNDEDRKNLLDFFKENINSPIREINGTIDKKNKKDISESSDKIMSNTDKKTPKKTSMKGPVKTPKKTLKTPGETTKKTSMQPPGENDTVKLAAGKTAAMKTAAAKVAAAKKSPFASKVNKDGVVKPTKKTPEKEAKATKKSTEKTPQKTLKVTKKDGEKTSEKKATKKASLEKTPDKNIKATKKTSVEKTPDKIAKAAKKLKSPTKIEPPPTEVEVEENLYKPVVNDSFEFVDETQKVVQKVIAGRIGGKRISPFGVLPKFAKKSCHETEDHKLKSPIFSSPLCFSDILPTRNPSRRWGHSFCPLNPGNALVIGGEGEKKLTNADSIWHLDTSTSTWKSEQTDNASVGRRVGHTACFDEKAKVVYLYGGLKHDKWFNDVYILNINSWKWTKIEAIGKAPTRAYHSCTMDFEELLIFGGVYPTPAPDPDGCSNELLIFSTESKSWYSPIVSGDIPPGRSGHSACMLDRKLYIFGGWDAPQCFNDMYVLDLGIMNFVQQKMCGTVPSPRTWHASQLLSDNKRFCIYGGFNGQRALDDLFIFHSADNSWTKLFYPGLVCRAGHDVIRRISENESGEKLLVFGGGDNDGHFYNDLATLNLG